MSFASVTIIMACLIIMGSVSLLTLNIDSMIKKLEDQNEVVAFVDDSYTEEIPALGHIDEDNNGLCDRCEQQMEGGDHCPKCGKIHNGGFFDKLTGFFHRIIYRLTHLFQR